MEAAAVRRNPSVSSPSSGSSAADIDDVETIGGGNTQFRRKSWIVSQFSVDWDWKSILLSMLYGQLLSAVLSGYA